MIKPGGVKFAPDKKEEHQVTKGVVHHGIEHIALEPSSGVFPDLTDNIRLRVDLFYQASEDRPKLPDYFIGHIQPPPVDSRHGPKSHHPKNIPDKGGLEIIKLRQGLNPPPTLIVGSRLLTHRVLVTKIPVVIKRILSSGQQITKSPEFIPRMVKNSVQNQ